MQLIKINTFRGADHPSQDIVALFSNQSYGPVGSAKVSLTKACHLVLLHELDNQTNTMVAVFARFAGFGGTTWIGQPKLWYIYFDAPEGRTV